MVNLSRTSGLPALLRHDHIEVLNTQLNSFGADTSSVFFKCIDENTHSIYKHAFDSRIILRYYKWNGDSTPLSTGNANPLVREFNQLFRMYEHKPENITMPIALGVADLMCIGYFSEYVKGDTMENIFHHLGPDMQIKLLKETADTVFMLHSKGIGHGDINRRNIIVTPSNTIKLIDPLVPYEGCSDESLMREDRRDLAGILLDIRYIKRENHRYVYSKQ